MPATIPPQLVNLLRQANHVAVLTGAGISAESGIPTFREAQTGLWAQYDPQELATPEAFQRNPRLVWEWYAWRRELVGRAAPNAGHHALAKLATHVPRLSLITQNIDGLHQQAGSPAVLELHGNLARSKCFDEGRVVTVEEMPAGDDIPPRCPHCGGLLRPDVVWFGESLPAGALEQAVAAARSCEVFFSVGTSAVVYPAAALPLEAVQAGATTVEVNPQRTPLSDYFDFVLNGSAGEVLPALLQAAWPD